MSRKTMITPPANAAGTTVRPGGAAPEKTPALSSTPSITSVVM
jgi:hypothetical protein